MARGWMQGISWQSPQASDVLMCPDLLVLLLAVCTETFALQHCKHNRRQNLAFCRPCQPLSHSGGRHWIKEIKHCGKSGNAAAATSIQCGFRYEWPIRWNINFSRRQGWQLHWVLDIFTRDKTTRRVIWALPRMYVRVNKEWLWLLPPNYWQPMRPVLCPSYRNSI